MLSYYIASHHVTIQLLPKDFLSAAFRRRFSSTGAENCRKLQKSFHKVWFGLPGPAPEMLRVLLLNNVTSTSKSIKPVRVKPQSIRCNDSCGSVTRFLAGLSFRNVWRQDTFEIFVSCKLDRQECKIPRMAAGLSWSVRGYTRSVRSPQA